LKRNKELPELTRQGLKKNGVATTEEWNGYTITKRTFTISGGNISLWEYIYRKSYDDWIILHRYARKIDKNGKQKKQKEKNLEVNEHISNRNSDGKITNNNIDGNDNENNQLGSETAHVNSQDYWQSYTDEHHSAINNTIDGNDSDIENCFNQDGTNSNQNNQQHEATNEVYQCMQILIDALQNPRKYNENIGSDIIEIMEDGDGFLPDVPSSLYLKLLHESIEKKKFFDKPIKIYEELFQFKLASDDEDDGDDDTSNDGLDIDSDDEVEEQITSFCDLTQDGFQFIVDNKLIHLTSPAGTGKTMTIWQLAKSVDENFRRKLVPVAIKGQRAIIILVKKLICDCSRALLSSD
jgi:flagellar biosynthesis GTPase FlhF